MCGKKTEKIHNKEAEVKEKEKSVLNYFGQQSHSLKLQLEGTPNFIKTSKKNDIAGLLKLIRGFCYNHDKNNDKVYLVMNSLRALFINFQKSEVSNGN